MYILIQLCVNASSTLTLAWIVIQLQTHSWLAQRLNIKNKRENRASDFLNKKFNWLKLTKKKSLHLRPGITGWHFCVYQFWDLFVFWSINIKYIVSLADHILPSFELILTTLKWNYINHFKAHYIDFPII